MKKSAIAIVALCLAVTLLVGCGMGKKGMKCVYTDPDGGKVSTMYIKNGMLYSEASQDSLAIKGLSKDDKFYIRSDNETKGMVVDLKMTQELKMGTQEITSTQSMITFIQKEGTCTTEDVADSLFEMPADKTF